MPSRKEKTSSRMGSLTGSNQRALKVRSLWKKVLAMTPTASPKKPPKSTPQTVVEMPQ